MEFQLDIDFKQLVQIAKQLPKQKWNKLKHEVEQQEQTIATTNSDLENFLLNGPTFSQDQLDKIANARTEINRWRTS